MLCVGGSVRIKICLGFEDVSGRFAGSGRILKCLWFLG